MIRSISEKKSSVEIVRPFSTLTICLRIFGKFSSPRPRASMSRITAPFL